MPQERRDGSRRGRAPVRGVWFGAAALAVSAITFAEPLPGHGGAGGAGKAGGRGTRVLGGWQPAAAAGPAVVRGGRGVDGGDGGDGGRPHDGEEEGSGALALMNPAPALSVGSWVHGEPVEAIEEGKVYAVLFWATWNRASTRALVELSDLQKTRREAGLRVVGVSVLEPRGKVAVESYVRAVAGDDGSGLDASLGVDDNTQTDRDWVWASGWERRDLPVLFIVDRQKRVAWITNDPDRFDGVIAKVLDGTFDVHAQEAEERAHAAERDAALLRIQTLHQRYDEAEMAGDDARALAFAEEILKLTPDDAPMGLERYRVLRRMGRGAEAAQAAAALVKGIARNDAEVLNDLGWELLGAEDETTPSDEAKATALTAAERANLLTGGRDAAILDTFARALAESGRLDEAIEHQRRAVEMADESERELLEITLKKYEHQRESTK